MNSLSPQLQKALAIALLLALGAACWSLFIAPMLDFYSDRGVKRSTQLRSMDRDLAVVAEDPAIETALDSLKRSSEWARLYPDERPDKAVIDLETDLRQLIAIPNNPTSIIAVKPTSRGMLTRIGVRVTLTVTIDQLAEVLGRVRNAPRFLQIENLSVQGPDYQIVDTNPLLSVQAELAAYTPARLDEKL